MHDTLALWHADHSNFAKLLDLLEGQLEPLCQGEATDYSLMLDILFYMTRYADTFHHPMEDRVFAIIKERDEGVRRKVDELMKQHGQLRESGDALVTDLDDVVNGSITSREHVEALVRRYVANFRDHMRIEEKEMIPLAAHVLGAEDWSSIDDAIRRIEDPLFGPSTEARYAALREQIRRQAPKSD
jgi:hemerythrin-like domain-containing protein